MLQLFSNKIIKPIAQCVSLFQESVVFDIQKDIGATVFRMIQILMCTNGIPINFKLEN